MQQRAGLQSKDTECSIDTVSLLVSTRVRTMSPWLMGAVRGRASEDAAVGAIRVSRLQPGAVVLLPVLGLVYAGELRWLRRCHLVTATFSPACAVSRPAQRPGAHNDCFHCAQVAA
jgi:hypothetical protein